MIGDLEGERRIGNWKTGDALTKHLKFVTENFPTMKKLLLLLTALAPPEI